MRRLVLALLLLAAPASAQNGDTRVFRLGEVALAEASIAITRDTTLPELARLGFAEGRNLVVDARAGEGAALAAAARALAATRPDAIIAIGPEAMRAARAATDSVPIVMFGSDPVELGIVTNLARPGGNATGVMIMGTELGGKRLDLLREALPAARRLAVLMHPASPMRAASESFLRSVAARSGVELVVVEATGANDYATAFAAMRAAAAQGLLIQANPGFFCRRRAARGPGARQRPADDVRVGRDGAGRMPARLRAGSRAAAPAPRRLRLARISRHAARRSADRGADDLHLRRQPADGAHTRHRPAAGSARARRRGDRVTALRRLRRRDVVALVAGAAVARPGVPRAQAPGRVYRIAIVHPSAPVETFREQRFQTACLAELNRLGYVEGANPIVQRYSGEGRTDRYGELARQVASAAPDAVLSISARLTLSFKAATTTIPIVAVAADPLGFGLAASLARPGGNITGVIPEAGADLDGKRLELLHEAVATAMRIAYLTLPVLGRDPRPRGEPHGIVAAATRLGLALRIVLLAAPVGEPEYRRAFATMAQAGADALIVADTAENGTYHRLIIELAQAARLPALYFERAAVEHGGLMSYGVDYTDLYRRAGGTMAQILGGVAPGEIPFYQAATFELAVNRATAAALGLTLPPTLLALADAVIE